MPDNAQGTPRACTSGEAAADGEAAGDQRLADFAERLGRATVEFSHPAGTGEDTARAPAVGERGGTREFAESQHAYGMADGMAAPLRGSTGTSTSNRRVGLADRRIELQTENRKTCTDIRTAICMSCTHFAQSVTTGKTRSSTYETLRMGVACSKSPVPERHCCPK